MNYQNKKAISLKEWNKLVQKAYGRIYNFQQQDGCRGRGIEHLSVPGIAEDYKNDSIPEEVNGPIMGVSFKAWLSRDPKQPIEGQEFDYERELWWERNFYPNLQMVANDLCKKKIMEAGEYIIEIDW